MSVPALDPVIHPINRLRICAALKAAGATESGGPGREMKFAVLRDLVGLSDSTLSKQLSALQAADYISSHREYGMSRDKDAVWVSLTAKGGSAFGEHLRALQQIADGGQPGLGFQ